MNPDDVYGASLPETTFFFYDLETSGLNPRDDRIMQFAGQRTDLNFNKIGDPVNLLVKMNDDTLPTLGAIKTTKITPQETTYDGLAEAEFCQYLEDEIFTPGTIEVGYNSVRFDDEFMRYLFWRNFRDPYEWQWKDGRSRWDLLDVVRMTRALRPEGINWPVAEVEKQPEIVVGSDKTAQNVKNVDILPEKTLKPTNRLELLTKANGISHEHAHDALSDVEALISVTKLIHDKSPKLYDFLFSIRNKNTVKKLVNLDDKKPFVYTSGRYGSKYNFTTVAFPLTSGRNGNVIVFDLRYNLDELLEKERSATDDAPFSWGSVVKELGLNKCPAVAPLGVLDAKSEADSTDEANPMKKGSTGWEKIGLSKEQIDKNLEVLLSHPDFAERMRTFFEEKHNEYEQRAEKLASEAAGTVETAGNSTNGNHSGQTENVRPIPPSDAESKLYSGFLSDSDRRIVTNVRKMSRAKSAAEDLADFHPDFTDSRLDELLLHFKARNFPTSLTPEEREKWEAYRRARLSRQEKYFVYEMQTASQDNSVDDSLLQDLMLWYQSLSESDY